MGVSYRLTQACSKYLYKHALVTAFNGCLGEECHRFVQAIRITHGVRIQLKPRLNVGRSLVYINPRGALRDYVRVCFEL